MTKNELINEINKFIIQSVKKRTEGYPSTYTETQYRFKELSILTDNRIRFECNMTGYINAFLDNERIGSVEVKSLDPNDSDDPIDAEIYIHNQTKTITFNKNSEFEITVPCETSISLYYLLISILENDLERTKYKFEQLEFEGFYG